MPKQRSFYILIFQLHLRKPKGTGTGFHKIVEENEKQMIERF
jgi:hypothetical protein